MGLEATSKLLKTEPVNVKPVTVMGSGPRATPKSDENGDKQSTPEENVQEPVEDKTESKVSEENVNEEAKEIKGEGSEEDEIHNEDDEDDDEGWITPSNYKQKLKDLDGTVEPEEEAEQIPVACLTTDFAMQVTKLN